MHLLSVVDVGHGNCAIISSGGKNVVIDTASRTHLLSYLEVNGITKIDVIVISHSDQDHIGGLINVLSSTTIKVDQLIINPDAKKNSVLWADVRSLVDKKVSEKSLALYTGVYAGGQNDSWAKISDRLALEVASPSPAMVLGGPGISLPEGNKNLTSNSASIVVRVIFDGKAVALLTGDMDSIALAEIKRSGVDLKAPYLIFPHHGGLPGTIESEDFAEEIVSTVQPNSIIFSNGRGRHDNPRPEIVRAVKAKTPEVYIACTQLSKTCCEWPLDRADYQPRGYSAGSKNGEFCVGSFEINLETGVASEEQLTAHRTFVAGLPKALCCSSGNIIVKG
ncbi:ComEC/Rec2 family competence protein [Metapseudomonas otitidis]|uniref:ComEC/Rec2 family competence protein n=1 Tax=Metapseudomonas otitidis TaxID=319939 RepID=UPI001CA444A9|nr:MBL fold metallo-hydrolase [Pseudomonas otitidis]QZX82357.1 MBL fold metallo-hydrolase [Pseudomonas otitidis]